MHKKNPSANLGVKSNLYRGNRHMESVQYREEYVKRKVGDLADQYQISLLWDEKPAHCGTSGVFNKRTGECFPVRCKTWRCPSCGPMRAYSVKSKIVDLISPDKVWHFVTLTIDPKIAWRNDPVCEVDTYVKRVWDNAKRSLHREYGRFSFIWVLEFHKMINAVTGGLNNPYPHLHVLMSVKPDIDRLGEIWSKAGGGVEVDVRAVEDHQKAVGYMCKYLKKDALRTAKKLVKRKRIWGRSRDLLTAEERRKVMLKDLYGTDKMGEWEFLVGAFKEQSLDMWSVV